MDPWQSWAVVAVVGGAAYWYYGRTTQSAKPNVKPQEQAARPGRQQQNAKSKHKEATKAADPIAQTVAAASAASTSISSGISKVADKAKGRKTQNKSKSGPEPAPVKQQSEPSRVVEEEADDFDFAERLSAAKKGTSLASSGSKEARSKTVKQKSANSAPQASSSVENHTPSGKDVSDMLEEPKAGPSVLRVTESANPAPTKKAQPKQAPPPQETKKQRQNRRKAEEKKAQKEEDEKERRILQEKQMKTAREARGEPARNGVQPANAPANNAWAESGARNSNQLLDTFEQDGTSTKGPANVQDSNTITTSVGSSFADLPPENEQIQQAIEETSWNTVPAKRSRKKTTGSTGDSVTGEEGGAVKEPDTQSPKETVPAPAVVTKPTPVEGFGVPSIYDNISNPNDSDWAVV